MEAGRRRSQFGDRELVTNGAGEWWYENVPPLVAFETVAEKVLRGEPFPAPPKRRLRRVK